MNSEQCFGSAYQALRIVLGGTAFAAGLDKFFNPLTDWDQYVSLVRRRLLMGTRDFVRLAGIIEMKPPFQNHPAKSCI